MTHSEAAPAEPCRGLRSDHAAFSLHAPDERKVAAAADGVLLLAAFSGGGADFGVDRQEVRRVRLRKGALWLFPATERIGIAPRDPLELLTIAIDAAHFSEIGERAANGRTWSPGALEDVLDPALAALAGEIRRALLDDPVAEPAYLDLLADAMIARLTCLLIDDARTGAAETLAPFVLARVTRHIEESIDSPIRVDDLAEMAGLSRSHFSRAFRRTTGVPPQRFILTRRLCRARDLISAGAADLSAVAAQTGFSSHAHMTTAFRKELGLTPARYRAAFNPPDEAESA